MLIGAGAGATLGAAGGIIHGILTSWVPIALAKGPIGMIAKPWLKKVGIGAALGVLAGVGYKIYWQSEVGLRKWSENDIKAVPGKVDEQIAQEINVARAGQIIKDSSEY